MPSVITSTTLEGLEPQLIAVIRAIAPRHTQARSLGWLPTPENRAVSESSESERMFYIELVPGDLVPGGLTGNGDVEDYAGLDVLVDYRAFDETDRGTMVGMDRADLHDAFEAALDPVIPGFTAAELAGEPQVDGDPEAARFRFPFRIQYMRQKRG